MKDTLSGTDKESHDITRSRDTENAETVSDSGADGLKVTGTDTEDTNGTIKVKDSGTVSNSETTSNNSNTDRFLTRSGNVGVTTTQTMLLSEVDVRAFNIFLDRIFYDVDRVLTSPCY